MKGHAVGARDENDQSHQDALEGELVILEWRICSDGKVAIAILATPLLPILAEIVVMDRAAVRTANGFSGTPSGVHEKPESLILAHERNVVQRDIAQFGRFQEMLGQLISLAGSQFAGKARPSAPGVIPGCRCFQARQSLSVASIDILGEEVYC